MPQGMVRRLPPAASRGPDRDGYDLYAAVLVRAGARFKLAGDSFDPRIAVVNAGGPAWAAAARRILYDSGGAHAEGRRERNEGGASPATLF